MRGGDVVSYRLKRSRKNRRALRRKSAPHSIQDSYLWAFKTMRDPKFLKRFGESLGKILAHKLVKQIKKRA